MVNTTENSKIFHIAQKKRNGERITALTAYDFPQAQLVDKAGVDIILVGDSLGNVVLGRNDTLEVTLDEMEHHLRAVCRAQPEALVVADLPNHSYGTLNQAMESAQRLFESGAEAVKLEGGTAIAEIISSIAGSGIPVMGHAGLLPQTAHLEGGYRIRGKHPEEAEQIRMDVRAIEASGAFAVVLELVEKKLAGELSGQSSIPTIGIGSGTECDGQILVLHDLLGLGPGPFPRHANPPVHYFMEMKKTIEEWSDSVRKQSTNG
jgi:3-methyl-2-oxobutanoate hydroxymethyltransferase